MPYAIALDDVVSDAKTALYLTGDELKGSEGIIAGLIRQNYDTLNDLLIARNDGSLFKKIYEEAKRGLIVTEEQVDDVARKLLGTISISRQTEVSSSYVDSLASNEGRLFGNIEVTEKGIDDIRLNKSEISANYADSLALARVAEAKGVFRS